MAKYKFSTSMDATYINVECIRAMHSFGCALCLFVQSRYWSRRRCPRREEERERAKKERGGGETNNREAEAVGTVEFGGVNIERRSQNRKAQGFRGDVATLRSGRSSLV